MGANVDDGAPEPKQMDEHLLHDFLDFIITRFGTNHIGDFKSGCFVRCFDKVTICENENISANAWLTNFKLLKFPCPTEDLLLIFRQLAHEGVVSRRQFLSLEPLAILQMDAMREGIAKAR